MAAAGALTVGWGQLERRFPVVRHVDVPVHVERRTREVRILQISDLHLYPGQEFLVDFLARVARTEDVDLVVSTGDNLGSADGLDLVRAAYEPFLHLPGAFVLGSNDYYSPRHKNWAHYLRRDPRVGDEVFRSRRGLEDEFGTPSAPAGAGGAAVRAGSGPTRPGPTSPDLPWHGIVRLFTEAGWEDLSNRSAEIDMPLGAGASGGDGPDEGGAEFGAAGAGAAGTEGPATGTGPVDAPTQRVALMGVDDPHMDRDRMPEPPASWSDPAALHLAVSHAPYLRVVDAFTHAHADLVLAGHTHGGQIGLPFHGALVSNCDLPPAFAKGLHTWRAGADSAPLHVSAGLGTSPFVPLRIATRPEVSVIRLVPTR